MTITPLRLVGLTMAAILAFAGNSLLTRAAIADGAISAEAFCAIRLVAGAVALTPFLRALPGRSDLGPGVALFVYAAAFSFAYLGLGAATGALILFFAVQASIVGIGVARGGRPSPREWLGIVVALAGLVWLFAPGLEAPAPGPALLMAIDGIAWGVYTLQGRAATRPPTAQTAANFVVAAVLGAPLLLIGGHVTWVGATYAVASGAITSGLGYAIWYTVAPRLGLATVAVVQLTTPIATAIGALIWLGEPISARLAVAGVLILVGVALTSVKRK